MSPQTYSRCSFLYTLVIFYLSIKLKFSLEFIVDMDSKSFFRELSLWRFDFRVATNSCKLRIWNHPWVSKTWGIWVNPPYRPNPPWIRLPWPNPCWIRLAWPNPWTFKDLIVLGVEPSFEIRHRSLKLDIKIMSINLCIFFWDSAPKS